MKERRMYEENITTESRNVSGYAIVFNSESRDLGGFKEIITPSALDGVIAKSDVLCLLKRGDITASSFAFKVSKDKWDKRSDGSYLRTICSIDQMFDVSPVYRAAYDATSVATDTRGLDKVKADEKKVMEEYYKQLRKDLN